MYRNQAAGKIKTVAVTWPALEMLVGLITGSAASRNPPQWRDR
jgi:hypothetical protein